MNRLQREVGQLVLIGQMQLFAWAAVATVVSAVGLMAAMAARRPPSARPDATLPADAPPG